MIKRCALVGLALLPGVLSGCADGQAAADRAARDKFKQIMASMAAAQQGFVPAGQEVQQRVQVDDQVVTLTKSDLQAYRQNVLADAAKELESILEAGSAAQQISTRRVLADVYAAQVRYAVRGAMSKWAALENHSATLMSYLISIDRADAQVRMFDTDESPLLTKLRQDHQTTSKRLKTLKQELSQFHRRGVELEKEITTLDAQSKSDAQQARAVQAQALAQSDASRRYDLYDQSAAADRRSNIALAKSQQLGVQLDIVKSEARVLLQQAQLAQQAIETLDQQIANARKRQQRQPYKRAVADKDQAIEEFISRFEQWDIAYTEGVDAVLDQAMEKISDAAGLMVVGSEAAGQDPRMLMLERLAHMVAKTHILTDQIMTTGSRGHTMTVIAQQARRLIPDRAVVFTDGAKQAHTKQRTMIEKAKLTISDAMTLVGQIKGAGEGDALAQIADQQSQRLESYRDRIDNQLRLAPIPD